MGTDYPIDQKPEMARAILFIGGLHSNECPETLRKALANLDGVVETLVTEYIQTPYGVAQVFYDSQTVNRDIIVDSVPKPYWAVLLEDEDPRREKTLRKHAEIYVC